MNDLNRSSIGLYLVYLMSIVGAITLTGSVAFHFFEVGHNPNVKGYWDCFWWTMVTVTTIGYGDVYPVTVGGRIIAIFLMFAGIGILGVSTAAVAAYFINNNQLQMLRIRTIHGHVIICGLGEKGLLLAKAFRERGQAVLVIEQEETNDLIGPCKEQGAIVMLGSATEKEMLAKCRIQHAKNLIAVCGDDGANAEITAHAREMCANRPQNDVLTCATHIVDPELWYFLRRWEIDSVDSFRLQFFNVFDIGARALLNTYPPFAGLTQGASPHVLVVGAEKLGQNVVVAAARLWRDLNPHGPRMRATIVDGNTSRLKEDLYLRHLGLEKTCEIEALSIEPKSAEFHQASFLYDDRMEISVTTIHVCIDDDAAGLSAALSLLHRVRKRRIPIVVRMTQEAGLATLLKGSQEADRGYQNLHAFGLLERICQPDLVLGGTNEIVARAIHEEYLRAHQGDDTRTNPAVVPWDELPDEIKESNRKQADHIGDKLQAVGCDIAPLTEWDASEFTFAPEEIERMAEMEHERWIADRRSQGWTFGPRDPVKKTNPNMVKWNDLPEDGKSYNRDEIRRLPDSLVRAGFQVDRIKSS